MRVVDHAYSKVKEEGPARPLRKLESETLKKQKDGGCGKRYVAAGRDPSKADITQLSERRIGSENERTARSGHEKPLIPRTLLTSPVNLSESKTGRSSRRASSWGSCVHPSIGIPFAAS